MKIAGHLMCMRCMAEWTDGWMDGWITGQLDRWMSVGASGTVHSSLQIELVTGF